MRTGFLIHIEFIKHGFIIQTKQSVFLADDITIICIQLFVSLLLYKNFINFSKY